MQVPRKVLVIIALCCVAAMCCIGIVTGRHLYNCREYQKSSAEVLSVTRKTLYGNSERSTSVIRLAHYRYSVDGHTYEKDVRVFFPFIYRAGKEITVYYDPADPEKVLDRFLLEISIFMEAFLLVFLAGDIYAIRKASAV